jgi:hypothetical protein
MSRRKPLPTTHRLGKGLTSPIQAGSTPLHSSATVTPNPAVTAATTSPHPRRQPVNRCTGPRFHACRAVAWRRRVHSATPSQIAEDRLPRHRERVSFPQVPSAGRPRIRALPELPPSQRLQNQSDLYRSGQAAGLMPARHPPGDGPRLTHRARQPPPPERKPKTPPAAADQSATTTRAPITPKGRYCRRLRAIPPPPTPLTAHRLRDEPWGGTYVFYRAFPGLPWPSLLHLKNNRRDLPDSHGFDT